MTIISWFEIALIGLLFMLYADQRTKARDYKSLADVHAAMRKRAEDALAEAKETITKHEGTIRALTTPKERRTNGPKKG